MENSADQVLSLLHSTHSYQQELFDYRMSKTEGFDYEELYDGGISFFKNQYFILFLMILALEAVNSLVKLFGWHSFVG